MAMISAAKSAGFNTLLVQVRGRGDAYYVSRLEPRGAPLGGQHPTFDPLQLTITAAHHAGMRVHAWVNVNLVSDAELPVARSHVIYAHPEWVMVPRDLAAASDPHDPAYLGLLSRYVQAHSDQIEGLYLSPIPSDAADYTVAVVSDIASRYGVDGIHIDYARYPNDDFDYSAAALSAFRADVLAHVDAAEQREYEERSRGRPLFYTQMFPQRWQDFRRTKMTELVTRLHAAVKHARPDAVFSAAVWPDPAEASGRRLQDWRGWLDMQLLDAICPMAYTTDPALFRSQIAGVRRIAGSHRVWAGIGAFHVSPAEAVSDIRAARGAGADGVILFSYDNLTSDYLTKVAEGAFER